MLPVFSKFLKIIHPPKGKPFNFNPTPLSHSSPQFTSIFTPDQPPPLTEYNVPALGGEECSGLEPRGAGLGPDGQ